MCYVDDMLICGAHTTCVLSVVYLVKYIMSCYVMYAMLSVLYWACYVVSYPEVFSCGPYFRRVENKVLLCLRSLSDLCYKEPAAIGHLTVWGFGRRKSVSFANCWRIIVCCCYYVTCENIMLSLLCLMLVILLTLKLNQLKCEDTRGRQIDDR